MKLKSLAIMLCLSFCQLFAGEEVVTKLDVETLTTLFDQWLVFSEKERSWVEGNQDEGKRLFSEMGPDRAEELVMEKLLGIYGKIYHNHASLSYHRFAPLPGKQAELYQVKVYFFLTDDIRGAPLCESFLVTEKGGVLLQRRGAAEK